MSKEHSPLEASVRLGVIVVFVFILVGGCTSKEEPKEPTWSELLPAASNEAVKGTVISGAGRVCDPNYEAIGFKPQEALKNDTASEHRTVAVDGRTVRGSKIAYTFFAGTLFDGKLTGPNVARISLTGKKRPAALIVNGSKAASLESYTTDLAVVNAIEFGTQDPTSKLYKIYDLTFCLGK